MNQINNNVSTYNRAVDRLNQTALRVSQRESARIEKERSASVKRRGFNMRGNTLDMGKSLRASSI